MPFDTQVKQSSYDSFPDSTAGMARTNRRGELVVSSLRDQLVLDGRMFQISNAAKQTALAAGGTSYSDTAPAFSADIPTGTTCLPFEFSLRQGGTVAGGVITVIITYDVANRYTSGGTAITSRNMRQTGATSPVTSGLTWYGSTTSLLLGALTQHNTIWSGILPMDVATSPNSPQMKVELTRENFPLPVLVGPACIAIYTFAGTTQPSWFFRFAWAEIPTVSAT